MEGMPREELERLVFFENAREQAEKDWSHNPRDTLALTRWGGALLELAHFRQGPEAVEYIDLAVSKFEEALALDPRKHDALWCLGNALTSQGFLYADAEAAASFFAKARSCFERAVAEQPDNEVYQKALDMTARAPALHAELQKQFAQQQAAGGGLGLGGGAAGGGGAGLGGSGLGGGSSGSRRGGGGVDFDDAAYEWLYSVGGYVILAGLITGWVILAQRAADK